MLHTRTWATAKESTYAYNRQRKRLQGMLLMANGEVSWKRGSDTPLAASFLLVEKCIECYPFGSSLMHNRVLPQTKWAGWYLYAVLRTGEMSAYLGFTAQRL